MDPEIDLGAFDHESKQPWKEKNKTKATLEGEKGDFR